MSRDSQYRDCLREDYSKYFHVSNSYHFTKLTPIHSCKYAALFIELEGLSLKLADRATGLTQSGGSVVPSRWQATQSGWPEPLAGYPVRDPVRLAASRHKTAEEPEP